jgi:O-antigen ligase
MMTRAVERITKFDVCLINYWQNKKLVGIGADRTDVLTSIVLGLAPLFVLTVRGWTNIAFVLLLILSLVGLHRWPKSYWALRTDKRIMWLSLALAFPFVGILLSQLIRHDIQPSYYDGPLRPLAGILLLFHLSARRIDFVRIFQWTCPLAVLSSAIAVWLNPAPTAFWGGRWATYFVDPLTFGQYALLFGFISLLTIHLVERDPPAAVAFKISAFLVGLVLSVGSGSRSAWVAVPALIVLWFALVVRDRRLITAGLAGAVAVIVAAYMFLDIVHLRIDAAMNDYIAYFNDGNRDSSGGLRLSLARTAWELFLMSPLQGYGDRGFPPLQSIEAIAPFFTPYLEYVLHHHGVHNEILQNMIRSGIFGLIRSLLMFIVPFVIFSTAVRAQSAVTSAAAAIGLCYITAVFFFGMNTETFNLKFLFTFYTIMVCALAAQIIWSTPRKHLTTDR